MTATVPYSVHSHSPRLRCYGRCAGSYLISHLLDCSYTSIDKSAINQHTGENMCRMPLELFVSFSRVQVGLARGLSV